MLAARSSLALAQIRTGRRLLRRTPTRLYSPPIFALLRGRTSPRSSSPGEPKGESDASALWGLHRTGPAANGNSASAIGSNSRGGLKPGSAAIRAAQLVTFFQILK